MMHGVRRKGSERRGRTLLIQTLFGLAHFLRMFSLGIAVVFAAILWVFWLLPEVVGGAGGLAWIDTYGRTRRLLGTLRRPSNP